MKIDTRQIPQEGLIVTEEFTPASLELDTELLRFSGPLQARVEVSKITNAVTARFMLNGVVQVICGRCLKEFPLRIQKNTSVNFPASSAETTIDLDPEIREEVILDYPMKPLCGLDCKGLCPKCSVDLNTEKCKCK